MWAGVNLQPAFLLTYWWNNPFPCVRCQAFPFPLNKWTFSTEMLKSWYIHVHALASIRLLPAPSRCSPAFEDSIRVWTVPSKASVGWLMCQGEQSHPALPASGITNSSYLQSGYRPCRSLSACFVFELFPRIFSLSALGSLPGPKANPTKALVASSRDIYIYMSSI